MAEGVGGQATTGGANGEKPLRVVFMGTPDFAAASLAALAAYPGCEVAGVYTQPDRPCGRGRECKPSPVKKLALERGFPVFQPVNFKSQEDIAALAALEPDVLAVAAYGLILPQAVLDIPRIAPLNVHASLLPRYRGAAPIQAAILNGDFVTGITIMRMEAGLDTGPMLLQRSLRIGHDEHAGDIHDQLAELGGMLLVETLERLGSGRIAEMPQDDALASYAPKLTKDDGRIDWTRPAQEVHNRIRAMHPWPGAFFTWEGGRRPVRLTVMPGSIGRELAEGEEPGRIIGHEEAEGRLAIACADKVYLTPGVKPEGKKLLGAEEFCCGYLNACGE
jgi:methionyl-tRNA formyltransferase